LVVYDPSRERTQKLPEASLSPHRRHDQTPGSHHGPRGTTWRSPHRHRPRRPGASATPPGWGNRGRYPQSPSETAKLQEAPPAVHRQNTVPEWLRERGRRRRGDGIPPGSLVMSSTQAGIPPRTISPRSYPRGSLAVRLCLLVRWQRLPIHGRADTRGGVSAELPVCCRASFLGGPRPVVPAC
jgi:hypothetical protein